MSRCATSSILVHGQGRDRAEEHPAAGAGFRDRRRERSTVSATALPLPDKPSIAVLPFQNMSGDPEQEYFVDGMVEDIITALSRFKSLFVIARNSSFTYKGKARRHPPGRPGTGRAICAGGQRPQGRQSGTHHRTAH